MNYNFSILKLVKLVNPMHRLDARNTNLFLGPKTTSLHLQMVRAYEHMNIHEKKIKVIGRRYTYTAICCYAAIDVAPNRFKTKLQLARRD